MNWQNLTVLTSHDVNVILNSKVQRNSGSTFKAALTQGVSKASGRISLTLFLETPIFRKFETTNDIMT